MAGALLLPVDVTDEAAFPEHDRARRHLASMTREQRERLVREWNEPAPLEPRP